MGTARTVAVTGSASGIGAAVRAACEAAGDTVVGVDLRDAEALADLGTPAGRQAAVAAVGGRCGGRLGGGGGGGARRPRGGGGGGGGGRWGSAAVGASTASSVAPGWARRTTRRSSWP